MPTPPVLDFDKLLAPISPEQPTGTWLKVGTKSEIDVYAAIKDAADASRISERKLRNPDPSNLPPPPRWKEVAKLAQDALAAKSKDLWIATWLIEALTREHGSKGVRDGFRLVRELCDSFWGKLYPPVDPDDLANGELSTVMPIAGLNGVTSEGVLLSPLSEAVEKQLAALNQNPSTPAGAYQGLLDEITEASTELGKMEQVLSEKCRNGESGDDLSPPTSALRDRLDDCARRVREVAGDRIPKASDSLPNDSITTPSDNLGKESKPVGNVRSRESAFEELIRIADFFRKTEPHSPVSYALEQVVRWGKLPLPKLLAELIDEGGARQNLFRLTGIPWTESSTSTEGGNT